MQTYPREDIIRGIKSFIEKHGVEPSGQDFHKRNNLPTRKTIERRYGGLTNFRKELGLYPDHRIGEKRKDAANLINQRALEWGIVVYNKLRTYFEEPFIHKESSIFDDRRNRTDFKVYGKKVFLVDVFYPKDRHSLVGCVSAKSKKYPENLRDFLDKNFDKVIFLNLNDEVKNDIKTSKDFTLMSLKEFWEYCENMV